MPASASPPGQACRLRRGRRKGATRPCGMGLRPTLPPPPAPQPDRSGLWRADQEQQSAGFSSACHRRRPADVVRVQRPFGLRRLTHTCTARHQRLGQGGGCDSCDWWEPARAGRAGCSSQPLKRVRRWRKISAPTVPAGQGRSALRYVAASSTGRPALAAELFTGLIRKVSCAPPEPSLASHVRRSTSPSAVTDIRRTVNGAPRPRTPVPSAGFCRVGGHQRGHCYVAMPGRRLHRCTGLRGRQHSRPRHGRRGAQRLHLVRVDRCCQR